MAFTSFLGAVGTPVDYLLRRHRLPVLCDDSNCFVPLLRAWALFDSAARDEGPMLGWMVGEQIGDHNLNHALLRILERAPSLYQGLSLLVQKSRREASHIQMGIHERQDDILVFTHYPGMAEAPGYHDSQAYQLGLILDLIRHFLGRQWAPDEIGMERQCAPAGIEQRIPRTRIRTHQSAGYIAVPRASLPLAARSNESKTGIADDPACCEDFDFVGTLRAMLKSYLPDGYPSARVAAHLMQVSERTLARRLSAQGLTYGMLIDEVRFTVAKRLLRKPNAKIEDVAISVGFADQSNFTRMFRRIGGLSPTEYCMTARH
jgi:AraC-like DNA-binding protein